MCLPSSRLTDDFNHIFKFITIAVLFWSFLNVCSSLFIFHFEIVEYSLFHKTFFSSFFFQMCFFCFFFWLVKQSRVDSSPFEILYPLVLLFWSFAVVFVFCEFGEQVSNQYEYFNDELCECDWYLLPVEMQRILSIVMMNSQQPIFIQGYANTLCIRYTFKTVTWINSISLFEFKRIVLFLDSKFWIFLFYGDSRNI